MEDLAYQSSRVNTGKHDKNDNQNPKFHYSQMLPKKYQSKTYTAPIDHYNFYRRQDNNDSSMDSQEETDLEPYREQIARFEQTLTTGSSSGMWSENKNTSRNEFSEHKTGLLENLTDLETPTSTYDFTETCDLNQVYDSADKNTKNTGEAIFSMDRDHLDVIKLELANNSQDSEDGDDSSQEGQDNMSEREKKLAEIERDILHKSYGKVGKSEEKNGHDKGKRSGKYPASQPFVKLSLYSENVKQLEAETKCREIGHLGHWAVSSCKTNHGVQHLRDLEFDTYWQSEGQQPHLISVRFPVEMHFSFLRFYIDEPSDESYTPERISVRVGTNEHDLREVINEDIKELTKLPDATWVYCSLENKSPTDLNDTENQAPKVSREPYPDDPENNNPQKSYLKAYFVQLAIISNHQNGRDTHIRQVQVFSPRYRLDKKFRIRCDRSQRVNMISEGRFDEIDRDVEKENEYFTNCEQFKTTAMTKFSMLR